VEGRDIVVVVVVVLIMNTMERTEFENGLQERRRKEKEME